MPRVFYRESGIWGETGDGLSPLQGILLKTPGYWGGWPGQGTGPHRQSTESAGGCGERAVPHGTGHARSAGREDRPCVYPSNFLSSPDEWSALPQGLKSLFLFSPRGGRRSPKRQSRQGLRSGPCTARQGEPQSGEKALWRVFSFSALRKGGAPAGAQRSGSGGERRKERSLSGIFGFSRKWSGGVSSDDMGGCRWTSHHHG